MDQVRRFAFVCLAIGWLAPVFAAESPQRFPSSAAAIDVSVTPTSVRVREEYVLRHPVQALAFEVLDNPCSSIGPIGVTFEGRTLRIDAIQRAPWTELRTSGMPTSGGSSLQIIYDVHVTGRDAAVPIVLPAATLERADGNRGANVSLRVAFDRDVRAAAVLLPRLSQDRSGSTWEARLLAIPSVVRLRIASATACDRSLNGSSGGLERRFWTFVAVMAVWIPVYFWRLGRRDHAP